MTTPSNDTDLRAVVGMQQEAIEKLTEMVELHQRQLNALWRRVQDLEGVPIPTEEPPGP